MTDFIDYAGWKLAINFQDSGSKKYILLLPGGDKILGKDRFKDWQTEFLKNNISSVSVDFTGVGESPGSLDETSLQIRIDQAICVAKWLKDKSPEVELYLYGVSMGGYVALGAVHKSPGIFKGLILQAPAAYSRKANDINFGADFKDEIRKENSWINSYSFGWLKEYKDPVLLIMSEQDEVIPAEITEKYKQISNLNVFSIPIGHYLWRDLPGHAQYRQESFNKIIKFIK